MLPHLRCQHKITVAEVASKIDASNNPSPTYSSPPPHANLPIFSLPSFLFSANNFSVDFPSLLLSASFTSPEMI